MLAKCASSSLKPSAQMRQDAEMFESWRTRQGRENCEDSANMKDEPGTIQAKARRNDVRTFIGRSRSRRRRGHLHVASFLLGVALLIAACNTEQEARDVEVAASS